MKNLKLKKTMTKLISMILVLATVMGISCTCIVSASAQSMSSTDEVILNSVDTTDFENMSLDEKMYLLMIMMSKSHREYISALKIRFILNEFYNHYAGSGYDKEDVVNYLMENVSLKEREEMIRKIKDKILSQADLINRFKEIMNRRGLLY